jgi:5-methylcytosine-specific restriction endonuclease McrA
VKFQKPCIQCGVLSPDATCKQCHLKKERQRDRIRDADPARAMKKATLYNAEYKKKRAMLKTQGGICYLCGEVVPPGTGQADHIIASDPDSPLAITHSFCNQSRGNKKLGEG